MAEVDATHRKPPHPSIYLILFLPFGIVTGYATVTLAYQLKQAGISVAAIAALAALGLAPNTWKVLWAPIVDTTLTAKRWFIISVVVSAEGLLATALLPMRSAMIGAFDALVLAVSLAVTVSAMAVERFMAFDTPEDQKGQAGGWSQAGNLGGSGLGGGLGLYLAEHLQHGWISGAALGLVCLACATPLIFLTDPTPVVEKISFPKLLAETGKDVWSLVQRRIGLLALFICLLPIGTGAATNLWAAIAGDWHAGADEVALIAGVLSGLVSIVGCVAGGYLCDWMDRKKGYALAGLVGAGVAILMAFAPRTPLSFMVLASLYNLVIGVSYGAYSAVTLEAIGKGAAATKYNLVASISNVPILVMTLVDGWAQTKYGSGGMLLWEAGLGIGAVALYSAVAYFTHGLGWDVFLRLRPGGRTR